MLITPIYVSVPDISSNSDVYSNCLPEPPFGDLINEAKHSPTSAPNPTLPASQSMVILSFPLPRPKPLDSLFPHHPTSSLSANTVVSTFKIPSVTIQALLTISDTAPEYTPHLQSPGPPDWSPTHPGPTVYRPQQPGQPV